MGYPLFNKIKTSKFSKALLFIDSSARRNKSNTKLEPLEMYMKSRVSIDKMIVFLVIHIFN